MSPVIEALDAAGLPPQPHVRVQLWLTECSIGGKILAHRVE